MFKFNRHQFFNSLCSDTVESSVDATLQFWGKFWGESCEHDVASLLSLVNTLSFPKMVEPAVFAELFTYPVS